MYPLPPGRRGVRFRSMERRGGEGRGEERRGEREYEYEYDYNSRL